MKTHNQCIPCIIKGYLRLAENSGIEEQTTETVLRKLLSFLSEADLSLSPPAMGRELHRMLRIELNDPDPYKEIKLQYNKKMMDLLPALQEKMEQSDDRFDTAMRLAIAGNVIDFGAKYLYDVEEKIDEVLKVELAVDDSVMLREALKNAKSLLYVGDNCGEVVLDSLFLKEIDVPEKRFVVRGGPIINDITIDDARLVGIDKLATVVDTGDDSPGAVWEYTSEEFKELFNAADVVISKGQGNLEGLIDTPHPSLFFLFVTKCELIGERVGTKKGDCVVMKQGK